MVTAPGLLVWTRPPAGLAAARAVPSPPAACLCLAAHPVLGAGSAAAPRGRAARRWWAGHLFPVVGFVMLAFDPWACRPRTPASVQEALFLDLPVHLVGDTW